MPYTDLGGDYFLRRNSPERRARKNINDLKSLGWIVTPTDHGILCRPPEAA